MGRSRRDRWADVLALWSALVAVSILTFVGVTALAGTVAWMIDGRWIEAAVGAVASVVVVPTAVLGWVEIGKLGGPC